jgi:hypothetical protein
LASTGSAVYWCDRVSSVPAGTLTALRMRVRTADTAMLRMIADSPM